MAIAGALIGGAIGALGQKPVNPDLQPVNPGAIQLQSILGNQAALGPATQVTTALNLYNQQQLNALSDMVLGPGTRGNIQRNIAQLSAGQVPDDVARAIQRGTASQAWGGGFAGTNFMQNVNAEKLGLTSLNLFGMGMSSAESWLAQARAPMADASRMFFTPQQLLEQANLQQARQYQHDLTSASLAAAPDPATAALGQEIDRFFNTAAAAGMAAGGMAMTGSMAPQQPPPPPPPGGGGGGFGGGGGGGDAGFAMGGLGGGGGALGGGFANMGLGGGYTSMMSAPGNGGYSGMGLAGGQGVGMMQSGLGGFYNNWAGNYFNPSGR